MITDGDYLPDNIEVMTPIIDGLRRLSELTEEIESHDSEHDTIKTTSRHYSTDTASTDTFQTNDSREYIDRTRKTSKTESSDLSSLRNLSTNGLMMFDPLVINAVSASTSDTNRQLPDHDLVTSLNEQVTEIADRLSSIAATDVDIIDHNQMHSFSTNDVPTLVSNDDSEGYSFSGPRNEQLSCMPSTSHGYLIPNAISHEPAVLSSLSHNNSAVFNQDDESGNDINGPLNSDLPLIIPDNIDADIVNTNISIANANLSSLLLTNEEYNNLVDNDTTDGDNTSFHSAKMTLDREDERVKFMLGYESDHESPVDSGVSTENTSLDRSPDTDQSKDIKDNHFMQQNRVLKSPDAETDDDKHTKNTLESSFSDVNNDVTVNINYVEDDGGKNEAGSSSTIMDKVINRLSSDEEGLSEATNVNNEARRVLQDWGANSPAEDYRTIDEVITELRRHREADKKISSLVEEDNNVSSNDVGPSQSRPKKSRKASSKSKKKKGKIWSPGMVILDNRSTQNQNSPLRLNLDHFVDER